MDFLSSQSSMNEGIEEKKGLPTRYFNGKMKNTRPVSPTVHIINNETTRPRPARRNIHVRRDGATAHTHANTPLLLLSCDGYRTRTVSVFVQTTRDTYGADSLASSLYQRNPRPLPRRTK